MVYQDRNWVCARRPEPAFAGAWGLYCAITGAWLGILFGSEQAAQDALNALTDPQAATIEVDAAKYRTRG